MALLLAPALPGPSAAADLSSLLSSTGLSQAGQHASVNQPQQVLSVSAPALQAQMALSSANLARATQAINDINAAQAAAKASSQLTLGNAGNSASSWNGTALSGLNPLDSDPTLWINAGPLQKNSAAATAIVQQTGANALLTWQSFDLNKGETLVFDQQDHADWAVLNRIVAGPRGPDGSRFVASPSMILGTIQAPGSVYVINPNGVIFGPTAQINVHSLIASSLDVGNPNMSLGERNSFFLNTGILGNGSEVPAESFSYNPGDKHVEGDIRIDAGAQINASLAPRSVSPDAGGFAYFFAPNVENHGSISTPAGEIMMVAAQAVQLVANAYPDGLPPDQTFIASGTFRAVGVNTTISGKLDNGGDITDAPTVWRQDGPVSGQISSPGKITNSGLIDAERGVIILNGDIIASGASAQTGPGMIRANTSVTRNGQIFLDARLQLSLGYGVIAVLPDENGESIPVSALGKFIPGSIEMRGQAITMDAGALVIGPGATVSASTPSPSFGVYPIPVVNKIPPAASRITMASGSAIDVSGLDGVTLPMTDNFLTFKPFGNEFADQPLQRNAALRGQQLTVDLRQTGTLNGVNWIGTPLADLAGYASSAQRGIDQILTGGGKVSLSSPQVVSGQVVLRQGSVINVGGGYVRYPDAEITPSRLVASDGRIVDIANANPLDSYKGVAGVTELMHLHWGASTTQTFNDPLLSGSLFQPGYTQGSNAGAITLDASAYILDGTFYAGAFAGDRQRAAGSASAMPNAGSLTLSGADNLLIANGVAPLTGFGAADILPAAALKTTKVSAATFSDANFGTLNINFTGTLQVTPDADLEVVPGGSISLAGGSVDIEGRLAARSGAVSVESTTHIAGDSSNSPDTAYRPALPAQPSIFNLIVGGGATLDASGLWINDNGALSASLIGGAYIDGGSITLKTDARSAPCTTGACKTLPGLGAEANVDLTGNIVIAEGSRFDVSSGGRISDKGVLQLDALGRAAGKGGSIAFETYVGGFNLASAPQPVTTVPLLATIQLAASNGSALGNAGALAAVVSAAGFSQGGTFFLQAPGFAIGSDAPAAGVFALPASFFAENDFGAYALSAVASGIFVAPGTTIILNQRNLLPGNDLVTLATGAKVPLAVNTGSLPDIVRSPVNLTLSAKLPDIPFAPYNPARLVSPNVTALSLGLNAAIVAEPRAVINLSITGRTVYDAVDVTGFKSPIAAQTAIAEILGTIEAPAGTVNIASAENAEVWLGAKSRITVAGVALTDSRQLLYQAGTVLAGGSVTIAANDALSSVVGLIGATIDVSGAAGEFDLLNNLPIDTMGQERTRAAVWSDAGAITLAAPTLLYDGAFKATPGAPSANGGNLTIISPEVNGAGTEIITVRQNNAGILPAFTPEGLTPASSLAPLAGSAIFLADSLTGSGIASLTLSMGPETGDLVSAAQGKFLPGTLTFSGNVVIGGLNNLFLDASRISLNKIAVPTDPNGCNVCLSATMVALRGAGNVNKIFPVAGSGILRVAGDTIDIAAGGFSTPGASNLLSLSGVAHASFISSGDIRLRVPLANAPLDLTPGTLPAGELITAGGLTLQAAQIYPASSVDFTLKSSAADGTIAFVSAGAPASAPLSAGGQISVSAAHIAQGGRLLAPLGTIRLGAQSVADLSPHDPTSATAIPTTSLAFSAGSVTSLSLAGQTVPFGQTANGTSWSYDSSTGQPLVEPPAKTLIASGVAINQAPGATLDLSGGGDIQAIEFVPGTGGTRDVLAGANVYAIIPGYNPSIAPIDLNYALQQGDANPAAGSSVYLSGAPGLPAGVYTLLPAHYATLPGAYRVAMVAGTQDALSSLNHDLADGTARIAGYLAGPNGVRAARSAFFDVQSASVWRRYTEIDQSSGNTFFRAKISDADAFAPRLPADAGHAIFNGFSALNLAGQVLAAPDDKGRGSEIDIAAQDIQVLRPGDTAISGFVGLDATQLTNLGIESLLLGGVRSDNSTGQYISVVSNSVEISNDAGSPLQGPEIILVAKVGSGSTDPNAGRMLRLDAGSVVQARGSVAGTGQKTFTIGKGTTTQDPFGNGALLAVSTGQPLIVQRVNVRQANGSITLFGTDIVPGTTPAILQGNSVVLDTTGRIVTGTGITLTAANVTVAARSINFGTADIAAGFNVSGGLIPQLAAAQNLSLRASSSTIRFLDALNFAMALPGSRLTLDSPLFASGAAGTDVTLSAGEIDLVNSGAAPTAPAAGTGLLNLSAADIEFQAGDKAFSGFSSVAVSGSARIAAQGTGSLNAGSASLTFQTPLFLAGAGAVQSIITAGNIAITNAGQATPANAGEIGGTLSITGASVALAKNALLQATAGGVSLTATSGDITLAPGARILANGFVQNFFDTMRVAGGGSVQLTANQGSIDADKTAAIDVSSAAGQAGSAGSILLSTVNGNLRSNGGAFNTAVIAGTVAGDSGGRLTIDTNGMGTPILALPALFSDSVEVTLRQGDLQLASDLKAATVKLTADGGQLTVSHAIDASGAKGGTISLFGKNGVVLTAAGNLLATATDAGKHGGDILIGTRDTGIIDPQGGSIDVSNLSNSAHGGTVTLRAPLTGVAQNDVAINPLKTVIRGATSVSVEGYRVFLAEKNNPLAFNGIIDPVAQPGFYGQCSTTAVCTGTLISFVQNFALSTTAKGKFASIAPGVLHMRPGIELVNNDPSINQGDITVANNWNLGAGFAGFLISAAEFVPTNKKLPTIPAGIVVTDAYGNLLPQYSGYKGDLLFVPGVSQITSLDYRVGGSLTGEAGTLTLRAVRDVNVNNSITDGFFNTRNTTDTNYQKALAVWVSSVYFGSATTTVSNVGGYLIAGATYGASPAGPAPAVPYAADANVISPSFSSKDKIPLSGADLFPLIKTANGAIPGLDGNYSAVGSWSYRIVGGADTASPDPLALRPLTLFADGNGSALAGHGNVTMDGHTQYNVLNLNLGFNVTYETPTMIRTGTGSIDIAAARDFILADTKAPGVVYTAGRNSVALAAPGFTLKTLDDPLNPGDQLQIPVATNPAGFLAPVVLDCDLAYFCNPYGPWTEAAYPVGGGHLTLTVQQDILGFEHPTVSSPGNSGQYPNQQYFAPWLLAQGTALSSQDFGPFSPLSGYLSTGGLTFTPSQTSWWINFGSFDQGLMSLGGDVRVQAGRDIQELAVSLPTTARVSGGLSSTIPDAEGHVVANIPVMHLNPSGDLTVIAGRNLKSGSYYEGSGDARILVGGAVSASWSIRENQPDATSPTHPVSTVLALDTGGIALTARGSVDIAGIVSGPSLQNVSDSFGAFDVLSQSLSSYGPSSAVRIKSVGGDIVANSLSFGVALISNIVQLLDGPDITAYPGINAYPANFEAVALHGDVQIADSLELAPSDQGSLNLLVHDSLLLSNSQFSGGGLRPVGTGPSLVEAVFDAVRPLAGFGPGAGSLSADLGARLLHQNDPAPDLFYAATGDIIAGAGQPALLLTGEEPLALEITKPAKIEAARDIVDLSLFGQNLSPTDVTSVIAGRDLFYTGAWQQLLGFTTGIPDLGVTENQGGLSLAGPGFFDIEAGRNLGPFVTAAADITAGLGGGPASDPIGTGIVTFGNTVVVGNRRLFSSDNPIAANGFAFGANNKLARRGADIVALFGVGKGIDYQAVIANYIDPGRANPGRDYMPALAIYLESLGYSQASAANAWSIFNSLPDKLRQVFADKVFMSELKLPSDSSGCCYKQYAVGYSMINTMFPASFGYTDNIGSDSPVSVETGDLDLLHATIKTLQSESISIANADGSAANIAVGGNIYLVAPGGGINVGTTALEINPKLSSNSSLGILTLDNGAVSVFTDRSVLVNQSRILTVQGGDILMWSSNGDLDAGRGAKTTVDFKPLSVNFDPTDLQTINLNGLVAGAGIGTIRSTPDAPAASAALIAPRGTVNAGDAGLRSTGNLDILALLVLNAANIAVVGNVSGVPEVSAVNLSALESASASGGQAAKIAEDSVAAAANRAAQAAPQAAPSLITVEVLGFGDCDPEGGRRCPG